jgi:tetratricopeptide (TPR) repeat protein
MTRAMSLFPSLLVCALLAVTQLEAQDAANSSQRDQLQQLTAQLQQSPGDQALREKIIALALALNPKPATPDAATMAEGAAVYAFTHAQANSDYSDAAKEYEKALLLAPWLAADYFNCGVAYEKAGENKEAIRSFKLYLVAAPDAEDAQVVKMRIGGLQYAAQKAEDAAQAAAKQAALYARIEKETAQAQQNFAGLIQRLDGAIFFGEDRTTRGVIQNRQIRFHKGGDYNNLRCSLQVKTVQSNDPEFPVMEKWANGIGLIVSPTSESEFNDCTAFGRYKLAPDSSTLYDIDYFSSRVTITYSRQ